MYTCPVMFGPYTYRKEFDRNEMNVMDDTLFHQYDNEDHPEQFVTFVKDLIGDHQQPKDVKEGMSLYRQVKRCIRRLENHEPNNLQLEHRDDLFVLMKADPFCHVAISF